jgi:hypothetical protein
MDDPTSGCHPLNVSAANHSRVPHRITVFDIARKHVRNGLDATVGMPRETGQEMARIIGTKIIQEQERIEERRLAEAERPFQMNPRPLYGRLALEYFTDLPYFIHL